MMLFFIFLAGLFIGSFLNVVADRLVRNESIWYGRSHCESCSQTLGVMDLVPVFSFLLLGRRCRYCSTQLSWYYPLSELLTGAVFATVFLASPLSPVFLLYALLIASGCVAIFLADVKYRIIPDEIVIFLGVVSLLYIFLFDISSLFLRLICGGVLGIFFLLLVLITGGRGMGMGDVKFSFVMGFILGFPGIILGFYLSFLTGAIVSSILIVLGKKKAKSMIAFGPFLTLSTLVVLLYGEELWQVFLRVVGL